MNDATHRRKRLVVKIGSATLTTSESSIDYGFLNDLADQVARVRAAGWDVVIVTSAAIACGLEALGIAKRPGDMPSLQAAASVGQSALSTAYAEAFGARDMLTSVVLLTRRDTKDRSAYLHARDTLTRLLELSVVPVVNENDTVSVEQIRFGDNDRLSALIANIVVADALVLLTDVDALYTAPPSEPGSKRISYVPNVEDALAKVQVGGTGSNVGTGGMVTKMEAARVAAVSGIPAVLTCASNAGPAMMGDPVGTAFAPINDRGSSRRLWIGFASHPQGTLVADSGAAKAVRGGAASLLAAGVVEVKGDFAAGDAVWVDDEQGNHLAKGLVGFDSEEIPQMLGRNTAQLKRFLGEEYAHPLVHRDNLVLV